MGVGCKLRNLCIAYQCKEIYKHSPLLALKFPKICNTIPSESPVKGFCPLYDTYSGVIDLMQQTLREANGSLNKTLEGLSKRP